MKTCNKPCLANKDGKCAAEKCKGQIVTLRDAVMNEGKTMNDLISREAAIRVCKEWMDRVGINDGLYRAGLIISLKYLSPANQFQAKWVRNDTGFPACSNCGKVDMICDDAGECFFEPPYCMWCGAKMDSDSQ